MRYSLFSGGKRLRPVLLLAAGEAVGGQRKRLLPFACGIEMIHTYSLIHYDLPALDDDALRGGKPTSHCVVGESTAILAGDALLTEAFRVMTTAGVTDGKSARSAIAAIGAIAAAAGTRGMVGGQVADLAHEGKSVTLATVRGIHCRKTAALIGAATEAGALVGGARGAWLRALKNYGRALGLAVQIADDVRDAEASTAVTGKTAGRDKVRGKATYVAVLGSTAAHAALRREIGRALRALVPLGERGVLLAQLAEQVGSWGEAGTRSGPASRATRRSGKRERARSVRIEPRGR